MKRSGRIYIIAGIVLAVLAGALLFLYLNQLTNQSANARPSPTPVPNVDVVVAAKDIAPGTIVTGDMIRREQRKATEVNPEAVREVSEALDRMVLVEVKSGTPLKRGDIQSVAFVLPKGKRAMALPADDMSTIAGLVREGDFVDVVVSDQVTLNSGQNNNQQNGQQPQQQPQGNAEGLTAVEPVDSQTVVKTVLQRVKVLKVVLPPAQQQGNQNNRQQAPPDTPPATATAQARSQAEQKEQEGRITNTQAIVVLEVTDQEAEILRFIRDSGNFQLLLRGRDDGDKEETKGMTLDILIRDYGLPVPKPVLVDRTPE
jgi:pilus assembly protein CpaB